MAKFEGVKWAPKQFQFVLRDKTGALLESDAKTYAISRSIHYGLFLVFEGIRFYCATTQDGLEIRFLNLQHNLQRFRRGISYSLSTDDQSLIPTADQLRSIFLDGFFRQEEVRSFLETMARNKAQGYFRPFTLDEAQSIGVTFPEIPAIRSAMCSYDSYLGEPFEGVVVPNLVRAVTVNGTGCLKLGSNYLMSVKAVQLARTVVPAANAAMFLDDRPDREIRERLITEWDSSCCLIAMKDGRIIKIPEGPLILPSVTIKGVTALARNKGVTVEERQVSYGELVDWVLDDQVASICSIGTAGVLNRCEKLTLVDQDLKPIAIHRADKKHSLYKLLAEIREDYWKIYLGEVDVPAELTLESHRL